MKKTFVFLLACCAALTVCAQDNTTIHASITGLAPGQWVYWYCIGNSLQKDSVQTADGGFTLHLHIPKREADGYVLRVGAKHLENGVYLLYLEPGEISLKGAGPWFKDITLSGEKPAEDYCRYKSALAADPALQGRDALHKKANELYAAKDTAGYEALEPQFRVMEAAEDSLTKRWIAQHPASSASAWLLSFHLSRLPLDERKTILHSLTARARDNAPANRLQESIRIAQLTGIGRPAPDFTQNDTLGRPVSLHDLKGKYVLIDFWASWCGPCRAENPNVVAAFQQFKEKNFTVLGVSLDQPAGKEKWMKAIHDDKLNWTQVSDLQFWNNAVAKQYDIRSIPSNILVAPDGKILAKDLHEGELAKKLSELLP